ncbi:MAG: hypothetical protein YYHSYBAR_002480 [Candidatus Fervidibacter sacchari]
MKVVNLTGTLYRAKLHSRIAFVLKDEGCDGTPNLSMRGESGGTNFFGANLVGAALKSRDHKEGHLWLLARQLTP